MDACRYGVLRKAWELPFLAEARELAGLRRVVRLHLTRWGLPELIDAAQLCISELAANVIRHVGAGTPATLLVSMSGTHLRIEMQDPDTRALPTLLSARADDESGRGMALIGATAGRWGVVLRDDLKTTWCELETGLTAPDGHVGTPGVVRAETLLGLYDTVRRPGLPDQSSPSLAVAEQSAVEAIADLLQWISAHGGDAVDALSRVQSRCEAGLDWSC